MMKVKSAPFALAMALAALAVALAPGLLQAQEKKKPKGPPKPKLLTLTTKDGVILKCTFLGGTKGKNTVPIIMLHGWGRSQADLGRLALGLQQARGHAVMLVDLRGHGRSTTQRTIRGDIELELERMNKRHVAAMVEDVQTCKRYLLELHNKGELNIELLTIIGCDLGALVAQHFANYDWNAQQFPAYKVAQDTFMLVLISPPRAIKGLIAPTPRRCHPFVARKMPTLIVVGKEARKSYVDAKKIYKQLTDFRKRADRSGTRTVFLADPEVDLEGAALVNTRGVTVEGRTIAQVIDELITRNVVPAGRELRPWKFRRKPLSDDSDS